MVSRKVGEKMALTLIELEKEKFDNYVKNHPTKSHFLQSASWGEFARAKKNVTPYYMALVDEEQNIKGASLLLLKKLPLGFSYLYSPRGFVIDFQKKELVQQMTKLIKIFAKKKKAIFVRIDPDIIIKSYNYQEEEQQLSYNVEEIFKTLKDLGFKHKGFTKNFETMQPRYSFRIDLNQELKDIEDHFSKTTKQRIQKALKLNTEVSIGTKEDIDEFYHLMNLTENRKDFVSYQKDYYETLYEIFNQNPNSHATLFLGKVNFHKTIQSLTQNLENLNSEIQNMPTENLSKSAKGKLKELTKQKENVEKDIEKYQEYQKQYGDTITLSAHMIIEYGDKAWVLYAGNHNILSETYVNYNTYYEHIKYAKEKGIQIYDQFGTIGDLRKDNPVLGLHEFKKKFGGLCRIYWRIRFHYPSFFLLYFSKINSSLS